MKPKHDSLLKIRNPRAKSCQCPQCTFSRKFYRITAKLNSWDRQWMRGLYDAFINIEAEAEMQAAYHAERARN